MPHYEFVCNDCHKNFDSFLTLREYEAGNVKCPHCGSDKVEQFAAPFFAVTSKKS